MRKDFDGVAFDLDGTLYPNYRLYLRLIPFILKDNRLLRAMGRARKVLRTDPSGENELYRRQARLMADILGEDPELVRERLERLVYRGWEPLFKKIKPCAHVAEVLRALKDAGLKLGLLSDFPPENKLRNMGILGYWDQVLCSEAVGCLKPHPLPFLELIKRMDMAPERLLYVGNNVSYDIIGAKQAGIRAALFRSPLKKKCPFTGDADFVFSDYRQLREYVLS
jgi:putative hydrolase of the HAD superfamily